MSSYHSTLRSLVICNVKKYTFFFQIDEKRGCKTKYRLSIYSYWGGVGGCDHFHFAKKKKEQNNKTTSQYAELVDHLPPKANCFAPGTASFFGKSLGMD